MDLLIYSSRLSLYVVAVGFEPTKSRNVAVSACILAVFSYRRLVEAAQLCNHFKKAAWQSQNHAANHFTKPKF